MLTHTHSRSNSPSLIIACLLLALAAQLLLPGGPGIPLTSREDDPAFLQGIGRARFRPRKGQQLSLPTLDQFAKRVTNGNGDQIRGVYVPHAFALRVVQQPETNYSYVSKSSGEATLFASAAYFGVTGLLAHNYLSGDLFDGLQPGQKAIIIMGDGAQRAYRVAVIRAYRRVTGPGQKEAFIDLSSGESHTTEEIFSRFYRGRHHLTFQTCVEKGSDLDWGVRFVVAYPVN